MRPGARSAAVLLLIGFARSLYVSGGVRNEVLVTLWVSSGRITSRARPIKRPKARRFFNLKKTAAPGVAGR